MSRKRRDSFGMLDGLEDRSSCSSESSGGSGASSPEDSEDDELGEGGGGAPLTSSSSLMLIKTNGQVYTYPDGKAGMGQSEFCQNQLGYCGTGPYRSIHGMGLVPLTVTHNQSQQGEV